MGKVHCEALTSIMLTIHRLALEKLRYTDHASQPVPRNKRLCRFCTDKVENPEHFLLKCQANLDVLILRKIFRAVPKMHSSNQPCASRTLLTVDQGLTAKRLEDSNRRLHHQTAAVSERDFVWKRFGFMFKRALVDILQTFGLGIPSM
ncbi:hypothetical protein B0H19DRAFT_1065858 [Mycena capillaripes]|nr:hypothetical protein B0H19DRAFT_1065858 [Mycena capillaripes]